MLLEVSNLGVTFGGLRAVSNFQLQMMKEEIVALIGPNGAGKTTIFNLLTGVYTPTEGSITLHGQNIIGKKTNEINNLGIARTFQNIRLFQNCSVIDNIKIAYNQQMSYSELSAIFSTASYRAQEKDVHHKAMDLLEMFDLVSVANDEAKNLPYGKQRKLEIARAIATNPQLLLLDEPAAGMNPSETVDLMNNIRFVKERFKTAILIIEHDMHLVMNICERLVVLDYGSIIATGTPEEIRANEKVIAAYLGS